MMRFGVRQPALGVRVRDHITTTSVRVCLGLLVLRRFSRQLRLSFAKGEGEYGDSVNGTASVVAFGGYHS